ncbi:Maf family protein [Enterococcus sp. BWR-S5]|uniref:Maf family protein n=1 Tax=Enterococcus sp. BWR-S5 TaxID=2787714 RepID=UPI0019224C0F|nr:nucleoside triphosphate pyrophosphatase [Enterococcus sp. BWR-S5]MBL1225801.1 septum formation protein Maf [Enterococcus sp. BWR-S5]
MGIVLASQSPRRQELLKRIVPSFQIQVADINEEVQEGIHPTEYVHNMAMEKAASVFEQFSEDQVIGCDTIVVYEGEIIGKPTSREHAFQILKKLSGQTHTVYTAVAVMEEGRTVTTVVPAEVEFYELSDDEIEAYLDTDEYKDKAGAYGIQEQGALLVKGIKGDYYSIMGLPIATLARMLKHDYEQL